MAVPTSPLFLIEIHTQIPARHELALLKFTQTTWLDAGEMKEPGNTSRAGKEALGNASPCSSPSRASAGCHSTSHQGAAQVGHRAPDVNGGGMVSNSEVIWSVMAELKGRTENQLPEFSEEIAGIYVPLVTAGRERKQYCWTNYLPISSPQTLADPSPSAFPWRSSATRPASLAASG